VLQCPKLPHLKHLSSILLFSEKVGVDPGFFAPLGHAKQEKLVWLYVLHRKQSTDLERSDQLLDIYSMFQLYYRSCWYQNSWDACCCYCLHSDILTCQTSSLAYNILTKQSLITDQAPSGPFGYTKNVCHNHI
jgi:hypothetical protein